MPQPQQPPSLVYVSFSAEIIPHTTESLIATCTNLVNKVQGREVWVNGDRKEASDEVYSLYSMQGGRIRCKTSISQTYWEYKVFE